MIEFNNWTDELIIKLSKQHQKKKIFLNKSPDTEKEPKLQKKQSTIKSKQTIWRILNKLPHCSSMVTIQIN